MELGVKRGVVIIPVLIGIGVGVAALFSYLFLSGNGAQVDQCLSMSAAKTIEPAVTSILTSSNFGIGEGLDSLCVQFGEDVVACAVKEAISDMAKGVTADGGVAPRQASISAKSPVQMMQIRYSVWMSRRMAHAVLNDGGK